jgi:tricorn protease
MSKRTLLACLLGATTLFAADPKVSFFEPSISPDRSEIAFVSGGDIWTVPAAGGEAHLVVSHPASETRPLYSPDGKRLAFVSNRTGNGDIYVLTFSSGQLKRLTFDDAAEQLNAWSYDGKWLYFSSTARDIAGMNDVYRVSSEGGTPMQVSGDRYATEYFAAPSPDGATLAITARGMPAAQWWRKGHSHLDESEVWLVRDLASNTGKYERFAGGENTAGGEKVLWPMWAADGRGLYYVSDRGGAENIWFRAIGGQARQVTKFTNGRLLWPSISYDGKEIVFERDFQVWKMSTAGGTPAAVKIERRGTPAGPAVEHLTVSNQLRDLALSPDGKKIAFVAHGEVYAASSKDGGEAFRVTHTPGLEHGLAWAPDSKRLAYVSDRDGAGHIYLYDFTKSTETRLTNSPKTDLIPQFSPDGKKLAFDRDGKELVLLDVDSKQEKVLATGLLDRAPYQSSRSMAWSPDSKWIAYLAETGKNFTNVFVVPAEGGQPKQVSFLANSFGNSVSWPKEGKFIVFSSSQRTEPGEVARIDLVPHEPKFREDQFRELFTTPATPARPEGQRGNAAAGGSGDNKVDDAAKTPPKPVEIQFEGIRRRLTLLPLGLDAGQEVISPDGKTLLVVAVAAGQQNIYTYSLDELSRDPSVVKQQTSSPGGKANPQFSPDGKEVYFLEQGRVQAYNLDTQKPRTVAVTAAMDVDFASEKMEVFHEAWTYIHDTFFDPGFNGVNWDNIRTEYEPRIAGAGSPDEVRRIISLMLGELNASHSGISGGGGGGGGADGSGKLGLRFDRLEFETSGRLKVVELIAMGPGATAGVKLGDYVKAVDGEAIAAHSNLDELLEHKVGKRVELLVAPSPTGEAKTLVVRPVTTGAEKSLLYRQWVENNRSYVEKASGGKLGYIHLVDMSAGTLAQMNVDLDTEMHSRDGVVVDVRNNNGGFVNVYAIDILARRHYLNMTPRGESTAPARTALGQRALELPTILVVNQHSLSDAEDFTEGYRSLGLGKVVGEPTAGWIIYTGGIALIDGSQLRLPSTRITTRDGQPMEMHPRPVDIAVTRPIGESFTGHDSQLDAAVKELLKEVAKK